MIQNSIDLTNFTASLCALLKLPLPALAKDQVFADLNRILDSSGKVSRALIYCPDAFGVHALKRFPELAKQIEASSNLQVDLYSVVPPVTPVCFASLFTGAIPSRHGIEKYEKPVLVCDTLFDVLARNKKKTAIVTIRDSSIDKLFQNRAIDYFVLETDHQVNEQALKLIANHDYEVIVVYNCRYDDLLHETKLFSDQSVEALNEHVLTWKSLVGACKKHWQNSFVCTFSPDHGAHADAFTGLGDHGLDIPEDMELRHFFFIQV